jgi:hypothetical protein
VLNISGFLNLKPDAINLDGKTRDDPKTSIENSPKVTFKASEGTFKNAGLFKTLDKALVNSLFVTGFGVDKLTPPVSLESLIK